MNYKMMGRFLSQILFIEGIFMIPAVGEEEPILIGKISVASRFSFSMSLAEYPHAASGYMFYAAVIDKALACLRHSVHIHYEVEIRASNDKNSFLFHLFLLLSKSTNYLIKIKVCKRLRRGRSPSQGQPLCHGR